MANVKKFQSVRKFQLRVEQATWDSICKVAPNKNDFINEAIAEKLNKNDVEHEQ